MKFRIAVLVSVILHISIAALALYVPGIKGFEGETIYYVDFMQLPGDGGGSSSGGEGVQATVKSESTNKVEIKDSSKGVKDLTVKKETGPKLRYPDASKKKKNDKEKSRKVQTKKRREKEELVSVVRKDGRKINEGRNVSGTSGNRTGSDIRIGIGSGSGSGSGSGTGSGYGGTFPYAYYLDNLRNKISSSWYRSPGIRGKFVASVHFKIFRNGQIRDLELVKKSGNPALDLSALRAVKNAAPFPPLPSGFAYTYLGVTFDFEWGN